MNIIQKHLLHRSEVEDMTDHELLIELVSYKRNMETLRIIITFLRIILLIVIIVTLIHYMPGIVAFFRNLSESLQELKGAAESVQATFTELQELLDALFK